MLFISNCRHRLEGLKVDCNVSSTEETCPALQEQPACHSMAEDLRGIAVNARHDIDGMTGCGGMSWNKTCK